MKKRPLRNLRQNKNGQVRLPARRGWKPFFTSSLFLQYKGSFIICQTIFSDKYFEFSCFALIDSILRQKKKLLFCYGKDYLLFLSRTKRNLLKIFQFSDRTHYRSRNIMDIKLQGFCSLSVSCIFYSYLRFDLSRCIHPCPIQMNI